MENLPVGRFEGSFSLRWIGPEEFLYLPALNPFRFIRASGEVVRPDIMLTDGGTIAPILQVASGVSRWGYAWAFMIHDWEWERVQYPGKSFEEVNLTLAEAMRTMQVAHGWMPNRWADIVNVYRGVSLPVVKRRWLKTRPQA